MSAITVEDLLAIDEPTSTDFKRDHHDRPLIVPVGGGKAIGYTRSSSAAKTIDDTYNLELWARRGVAFGLAHDRSLVARVLAIGGDPRSWSKDDKREVNQIVEAAQGVAKAHEAADIGTAVHRLTERFDAGEDVRAGIYQADLDAYAAELHRHGLVVDPAWIECRIVCDELQMAGTADRLLRLVPDAPLRRLLRLADDEVLIADLKTGESIDYGGLGWAAQLAAYAHGVLYDPIAEERLPTPPINQRRGLIIHLPAGQGVCTLHLVDLEKGFEAALLANQIRATRNESRRWIEPVAGAPGLPTRDADLLADLEASLAQTSSGPVVPAELIDAASLQLRARLNAAVAAGARSITWPAEVARFADGGPATWAEVLTVEAVVMAAEAEADMPFGDPALPADPTAPVEPPRQIGVADVVDLPGRSPSLDPDEMAALGEMHHALPTDLQDAAFGAVVAAGLPTDRRHWRAEHAEALRRILESATAEHGKRKALVASTLQGWEDDDLLAVVLEAVVGPMIEDAGGSGPELDWLTHDEAERLVAVIDALDAGLVAFVWPDGSTPVLASSDGAADRACEERLVAALGSKAEVLSAAKELAALHGRPKPRSAATAAQDPVLAALLLASASTNQQKAATS